MKIKTIEGFKNISIFREAHELQLQLFIHLPTNAYFFTYFD